MPNAKQRIAQIRWKLCERWPHAAVPVMSLIPVEKRGIGTFAVDKHYRMNYDPAALDEMDDAELQTTIAHEVSHLLLDHHHRAERLIANNDSQAWSDWNVAGDAAVNDLLAADKFNIPDTWVTPKVLGMPVGKCTEWYFYEIRKRRQEEQEKQKQQKQDAQEGPKNAPETPEPESSQKDEEQPEGQPEPEYDNQEGQGDGEEEGDGEGGEPGEEEAEYPRQAPGTSGSCSDGQQREWEDTAPVSDEDTSVPPAMDEFDHANIKDRVAKAIESKGSSPGRWKSFIDEIRRPRIDPKRLLMDAVSTALRGAISSRGDGRFSYRRPARAPGFSSILRPSRFQVVPKVTVCIDTSGSMDKEQLSLAVGLVASVLDGMHFRDGIRVICGDTIVQFAERIVEPSKIELAGQGGTEMGVVLKAAAEEDETPDMIVLVTDAATDWPSEPLPMPVVACVTTRDYEDNYWVQRIPSWIKSVQLTAQ